MKLLTYQIFTQSIERISPTKYQGTIFRSKPGGPKSVAWQMEHRLRGAVLQELSAAIKALRTVERNVIAAAMRELNATAPPIISKLQNKRYLGLRGMFGKEHTDETRAKISAAMKARHAEGAFNKVKKGRLTNVERKERTADAAKAAGLSVAQYQVRQMMAAKERVKLREEFKRLNYIDPKKAEEFLRRQALR